MYLDDNSGLIQNISNILNCCHILPIQLHLKIEADHIHVTVAILYQNRYNHSQLNIRIIP